MKRKNITTLLSRIALEQDEDMLVLLSQFATGKKTAREERSKSPESLTEIIGIHMGRRGSVFQRQNWSISSLKG